MDRDRFEQLSLEQLDALYGMALQLARKPEEAADLVQETYVKALQAAERFEEAGGGIRPWMFKILHNVFFTRFAKAKREPAAVEDLFDAVSTETRPGEAAPAWDMASLDWDQVDQRLKAAIEKLRPEYRTVLLLWGVQGLKYRQIAEIEDVPIGTIMSRLHRARSILAEELRELAEERRLAEG